jgi:predicted ATPase
MPLPSELQVICPTMIGRSAAVSALLRSMDAAQAGNGQTVIVAGEAGIGKSRLLSEAWAIASQRGVRVMRGSCFEQDRAFP